MAARSLIDELQRAKLLTPSYLRRLEEEQAEGRGDGAPRADGLPHLVLLTLCDAGALVGGLTVELDVRPDELVGPLTALVGGKGSRLRVTDVRDGPPLELTVFFEDHEETWALEDLYPFVQNVNDLLKHDPTSRAVAVLGEWEDSLQLWAVEKVKLAWMFEQRWFAPRNRHQLEALAMDGRRQWR